ncbi:hypothetical protein R1sor_001199 [Riccia sorocarpa]|uniref:Cationic amino acid transporter C-terminal domain-containing protein n=1 Tax=Riccia sorocarpa TaxID=122646 RepID=A0ABD3GVA2_9MARC
MADSRGGLTWWSGFLKAALRAKVISPKQGNELKTIGEGELERKLGLWDLILLGIGASIGAGIFVITGAVAQDTGPGVVLSFVFAGAACILNALCYAELSSRFPAVVGGAYLYTYFTFNELTAFLVFVHLMLDYHIGAASIIRSLASYIVTLLKLIPAFSFIPTFFGPGGHELLGGWLSINFLAPILLILLTFVLCQGVRESAIINGVMTVTKIVIVLLVIAAGSFEVDVSNWSPFAPFGLPPIIQGATVVFFAFVGFDAVANSAEESKSPQRDLPTAIIASVLCCAGLYLGVCLVITGMVPYYELDSSAPLASAFIKKGLTFITILIGVGAVAGLTTTVLVGLYVQSRLYLGLGRDGLLPTIFSKVNPQHHTPVTAQIWVGAVAGVMATLIDVSHLSHILSVGALTGYSVVCACVVVLRTLPEEQWQSASRYRGSKDAKRTQGAIAFILVTAVLGFSIGLCYRLGAHPAYGLGLLSLELLFAVPMYTHQEYYEPSGFSCPAVPTLPLISILVNMFLFAQLHWEAWVRFVVVSALAVIFYGVYGQFNSRIETRNASVGISAVDEGSLPSLFSKEA